MVRHKGMRLSTQDALIHVIDDNFAKGSAIDVPDLARDIDKFIRKHYKLRG